MPKVTRIVPGRQLITVANRTDFGNSRRVFLTKKINQFLFLAVKDILVLYPPIQDKKKITHFFPKKMYSYLFTVQTLFSSIKPFYYISILRLIYVYYSAS